MLDQKSEVSKKFKKSNFPKGLVHGFCPKIELFAMRFFRQKRVFFNILDRKEYFSAQKREVSKMSPKLDFS